MADNQSRYCYPGTDVLINKAGLRTQVQLDRFEARVATQRLAELQLRPITGRFDLKHWQAIHKHIFGDIYPFAGRLREESIAKGDLRYATPQFIEPAALDTLRQLKNERHLIDLSRAAFVDRVSHYVTELYVIHPFRDGNSRSLREFTRTLGLQAGYEINWPELTNVNWFEMMRAAANGSNDGLHRYIDAAVVNREPDRELMSWYRSLGRGLSR